MRFLTDAFERMAEGVAFVDTENRLAFSNLAFADMHGYASEQLVGKHLAILFPVQELFSLAAANDEILRVGVFAGEFIHCRKDGASFPVFSTTSIVRNDQGSTVGMIMIVRDATETKILEQIICEEQQKAFRQSCELERRLQDTLRQLGDSHSEHHELTERLGHAKEALKLLISTVEDRNRERERTVYSNLNANVFTILDQLKVARLPDSVRLLLDSLEFNLKNLFSRSRPIVQRGEARLTPHETRLCELIRAGLTSKQIAAVMGVSVATVEVHRFNIRKKLGLVGSDRNLATYLRSKL